jgi:Tfp pilus assembly protein PilF
MVIPAPTQLLLSGVVSDPLAQPRWGVRSNTPSTLRVPLTLNASSMATGMANTTDPQTIAMAFKQQGNAYKAQGQLAKAAQCYWQAVQHAPQFAPAWFNLGVVYLEQQQWQTAQHAFAQYVQLMPQDVTARLRLAHCYQQTGHVWQAVAQYQNVLKQSPQQDDAQRELKWLLFQQAQHWWPANAQQRLAVQQAQTLQQAQTILAAHYQQRGKSLPERWQSVPQQFRVFTPQETHTAEYNPDQDAIWLRQELAFAHPTVVAAYLAHEWVHAAQADADTSLAEETQAYVASLLLWHAQRGPIRESNLDQVVELWAKGGYPTLYKRVAQTYAPQGLTARNLAQGMQ